MDKNQRIRPLHIAVIGAGAANAELFSLAELLGREIAKVGCILICGGMGGVMAGACKGVHEANGKSVAIIPGNEASYANKWADIVVATGLGHARNVLVVQSADAVIALPGSWGTMSEIALSLKMGRPVVGVGAWNHIEGVTPSDSPENAVELALSLAKKND